MIVTKEIEKAFRTFRGGVPARSVDRAREVLGISKFVKIIGKEITDDFYNELMSYKHTTEKNVANRKALKKQVKKDIREKVPSIAKESRLIPSDDFTDDFIKKFIENGFEGNLYGGLIPEWIHLNIRWDEVRIRLMRLEYKKFLKTYYWQAIRKYMIYKNGGHCTLCKNENYLELHHKAYDHHGIELFFLDELIVLCNACHAKEHGIKLLNTNIKQQ